ncbi:MAG: hypothetical protein PUP91_16430, partial [Rhizonema sp. PD37]|nr:hypothetical protein [Rhizonema sp. PD37]
ILTMLDKNTTIIRPVYYRIIERRGNGFSSWYTVYRTVSKAGKNKHDRKTILLNRGSDRITEVFKFVY